MLTLHLFGAGPLLPLAAGIAQRAGWTAVLRTSPRLWDPQSDLASRMGEMGIETFVSAQLDEVMAQGPQPGPDDIAVSFGAPWIFPQAWIEQWGGRAYNHHPRRLPEHRGGGGNSWLILMGERQSMGLVHKLTAGVDEGPVVASRPITFSSGCRTSADFDRETHQVSKKLLEDWLPSVLDGSQQPPGQAQPEYLSSYWPRLSAATHGWIDWSWTAEDIASFCDAFDDPYPGARTFCRGSLTLLRNVRVADRQAFHPFQRGLVFRVSSAGLHVAARGGSLLIAGVDSEGGDPRLGDRMVTPSDLIEEALATRVTYHPDGRLTKTLMTPVRGD